MSLPTGLNVAIEKIAVAQIAKHEKIGSEELREFPLINPKKRVNLENNKKETEILLGHILDPKKIKELDSLNGVMNLSEVIKQINLKLDSFDSKGLSIAHKAIEKSVAKPLCVSIFKLIIALEPKLISIKHEGDDLLSYALRTKAMDCAEFLLSDSVLLKSVKMDINAATKDDRSTPLHLAVKLGNQKLALSLKEKGAKLSAKNKEGQTPADLATALAKAAKDPLQKQKYEQLAKELSTN